jgi:hypothetical protein
MSDNTHDPPFAPVTPRGYQPEPPIPSEALAPLRGRGHEKYSLMKARLNAEPLEVIRTMKHGGHRYKSKRGYPGVLVLDRDGNPVPDRMSFRQIAPILAALTGVEVTYETIRRWWEDVFPDEADELEETLNPDEMNPPTPAALREASEIIVRAAARKPRTRPAVPPVGDDHADTIRAAMNRAKSTNPAIPPAAFVAPAE